MKHRSSRRALGRSVSKVVESLEERRLLSLSASGSQFPVNSFTTGAQNAAAIAVDGDGDSVVAWQSPNQEGAGSDFGIFAQRFNSSGAAQGSEFKVNSYTTGAQTTPAVAIDADGDFAVAWASDGQDGSGLGIYAQRFNALGAAQGGEFRVNTFTTGAQSAPAVAMDVAGDFVITWGSGAQESGAGGAGIYAQRFSFAGVAQGAELHVNTYTTDVQSTPAIGMDAAGDFVIAWQSYGQDAAGAYGVYAQRYNSFGAAQGSELHVNTFTTGTQSSPSVAMDMPGDFVIAWQSLAQDGSSYGIYAQRYNPAGAVQGTEFKVNTFTTGIQKNAKVAMDSAGDFTVAWQSFNQESATGSYGIYAIHCNAAGVEQLAPSGAAAVLGNEFRVNTYTTGTQGSPAIAVDAKDDFVIAWSGQGATDTAGVYAQRFQESTDSAGPLVAGAFLNGNRLLPYQVYQPSMGQIVVSFSENVSDVGGASGVNSVTNPANWLLTFNGADVTSSISLISYGFNAAANRYEARINLSTSYTGGNFLLKAKDIIRDIAGNRLDGNFDGAVLGNYLIPFGVSGALATSHEVTVNQYAPSNQFSADVAADPSGNYVVVWDSDGQDGSSWGVYMTRYDSTGTALSGDVRVNSTTTFDQIYPSVAMDRAGNFVVVWQSALGDGSGEGIYGQRYNASGVPQGGEFRVNTFTTDNQVAPDVAMDAAGDFVVTWLSYNQDGSATGCYAQRYNSAGVAQGIEFLVNTTTSAFQQYPRIAMDPVGNFVIAWANINMGFATIINTQRFNAAGARLGGENGIFQDGASTPFDGANIAMDTAGNYIVAWNAFATGETEESIFAQRFDSNGAPVGPHFRVSLFDPQVGEATGAQMAFDPQGDFVVGWSEYGVDGSGAAAIIKRYDASGAALSGDIQVNAVTAGNEGVSAVAITIDGDILVAFTSPYETGVYDDAEIRRFCVKAPSIASLTDNPDPVVRGNSITLSASGFPAESALTGVSFYRESNGEPGLQVGAFGDTLVGTTSSGSGGFWSINFSTAPIVPGTYTFWAQATDNRGIVGAPKSTTITITTPSGPIVAVSSFLYLTAPQKLQFTFDRDVHTSLSLADITIANLGGGGVPGVTMSAYGTDGTNVATFVFNSQLADGNYRATIHAAGVTDPISGNPMPADFLFDFFILRGDANHDRTVDIKDFQILALNLNGSGKNFGQGDFNYDGVVNSVDLGLLASRWQTSLAPPPPSLAASLPTAPKRTASRPISVIN